LIVNAIEAMRDIGEEERELHWAWGYRSAGQLSKRLWTSQNDAIFGCATFSPACEGVLTEVHGVVA
jgi:hypothetical protein